MRNVTSGIFKALVPALLCAVLPLNAAAADTADAGGAEAFRLLEEARSGSVFYDSSVDFSRYDKVMLFPVTYDQLKIADETNPEHVQKWREFDEEEWRQIAEHFDTFARKKFGESDVFALEEKPGEGVIAIQFRMLDFKPNTGSPGDPMGTVGQSINLKGLGNMKLQGVLVDSANKRLLAVIEGLNSINSGRYAGGDDRVSRSLAWRRSFRRIIDNLYEDMQELRRPERTPGKQ